MMSFIASVMAIAAVLCYVVWRLTEKLPANFRFLVRTLALAFVITPSVIGGAGHCGAAILPVPVILVFIAGIDNHDWNFLLWGGVFPLVFVWLVIYTVPLVYHKFSKNQRRLRQSARDRTRLSSVRHHRRTHF